MTNPYEFLGLSEGATRQEATDKYRELKSEYTNNRFESGYVGEEAAEKLEALERNFSDLQRVWERESDTAEYGDEYGRIQEFIKDGKLDEAQRVLDDKTTRDAEWHYMQSIIFYKRSWFLESKKQLEFCLSLDPSSIRYKDSLEKLNKILSSNTVSPDDLRTTSKPAGGAAPNMNNGTCTGNSCMDCVLCNTCCNCGSMFCCR